MSTFKNFQLIKIQPIKFFDNQNVEIAKYLLYYFRGKVLEFNTYNKTSKY